MAKHFVAFGNHPSLALAELVSVLPDVRLIATADKCAIVETPGWDGQKLMDLLGGTIKLGDVILEAPAADLAPEDVAEWLVAQRQKSGTHKNKRTGEDATTEKRSLDFGWTFYGSNPTVKDPEKFPMRLKKSLRESGLSVRWVTGDDGKTLSPAAVSKCRLTDAPNADLVAVETGKNQQKRAVYVGRTTHVQDADAWSRRDFGRPRRDDLNGMLPPKLARMMVNLAQAPKGGTLLDPFCGSGTVGMEAALATNAKHIVCSDLSERCVEDTRENNAWLAGHGIIDPKDLRRFDVLRSDVRFIGQELKPKSVDAVVTEGWLGPPLTGRETADRLFDIADQVADLWLAALAALKPLLKPQGKIVMVLPSYRYGNQTIMPRVMEKITDLGFALAHPLAMYDQRPPALFYQRQDQHVRRNIFIIKPK